MADTTHDSAASVMATQSPIGPGDYVVEQGDCIASIAAAAGLPPEKIWNCPANANLKSLRQNQNVLFPGDTVVIPDPAQASLNCATDQRHLFVLKCSLSNLVIILKDFDKPRAKVEYALYVAGRRWRGITDASGRLEAKIPSRASEGRLIVGKKGSQEVYALKLGHMDPISEDSGVDKRLKNLGYKSLAEFQYRHHLPVTGQPDDDTLNRLRQDHGC
jgi:hypothetical protein